MSSKIGTFDQRQPVSRLALQPDQGASAERRPQRDGHFGQDGPFALDDFVDGRQGASHVLFLASDDASFDTGIELFVDGGSAQVQSRNDVVRSGSRANRKYT
jgi:hypothetical protein